MDTEPTSEEDVMEKGRLGMLRESFLAEPLARYFCMSLETLADGRAIVEMPISRSFLVRDPQIVQGGISAVIADFAAVYAAMSMYSEGHTPATNIDLNYLRPIALEDEIICAQAHVVRASSRNVVVDVKVYGRDGLRLKVCGTITFAAPKSQK